MVIISPFPKLWVQVVAININVSIQRVCSTGS